MGLRDLFRRRRGSDDVPSEGDSLVLDQLRAHGADLDRPRHVIQYLYFPSDEGARAAAEALRPMGYEVDVRPPSSGIDQWAVIAEMEVVLDESWVDETRRRLRAVAEANGGEYDGWEAAGD
jgi:hypothetical protein